MRARRPPIEAIRRFNFRERISPSLWYVPGLCVAAAFVASRITVAIDRTVSTQSVPSWMIAADTGAAAALTSTVATAMLSFIAVVFSTTLVAIQLAGGQYSPRVVRVFVRSRLTHVTLGLYLATFVFALNGLVEVRTDGEPLVPAVTVSIVYLLLLATLGAFITFVHGMSKILRVQYLLTQIVADGRVALAAGFPDDHDYLDVDVDVDEPAPAAATTVRNRRRTGVIQAIDRHGLVEDAERRQVVIELLVETGEYLGHGTPVARVHGTGPLPDGDDIVGRFLLGAERTLVQDPGFVLRQLVDVASRALSPAINDPTTAVQVIDRIADLLGGVVGRADPTGWYLDTNQVPRLHVREPDLARMLRLAFVEIIRYGADAPQVVRRLNAALTVLHDLARPDLRTVIEELRSVLDRAALDAMPAAFQPIARIPDRHGFG
jgi:uncharacterized membrane protein